MITSESDGTDESAKWVVGLIEMNQWISIDSFFEIKLTHLAK